MTRTSIIQSLKSALQEVIPEATIILYGSEARGEARPDSDIDLLILVNKDTLTFQEELDITEPIYHIEMEAGVDISSIIMPRKKWEERTFKTPFYVNVMKEGIVL
ncbi:nucleotidyltransferase domain-containing protein [Parabacteroides sp. PF5-6]|uniref:nucleotidyltransferase domain-containing protein n=1 Tax=Parabacteroides sp. PF5-6 TaxID=1742403 RepID=UPI002405E651|nr:nucleotidyltransferase domain-containing protein [Parabacteroides sp. PF5-6]MDF9829069.1 putative nucleotidyltransferase [Parabacteroides sp. PF5-6]